MSGTSGHLVTSIRTCDGVPLKATDLVVITPADYAPGYVTNAPEDGTCMKLADIFYDTTEGTVVVGKLYASNVVAGMWSSVLGGYSNEANGTTSAVVAGESNIASGGRGVVVGGFTNVAKGTMNGVFCGAMNTADGTASSILSGDSNSLNADNSAILAGSGNSVEGASNAVLCGRSNTINLDAADTAVAGYSNSVAGPLAKFVAGYMNESSSDTYVAILLGQENISVADDSPVIAGAFALGYDNHLHGGSACGAIGSHNKVTGDSAIAIGTSVSNNTAHSVLIQSAGNKVGFFGVTPVSTQSVPVAATNPAETQTLVNSLRAALVAFGLVA